MTGFLARCLPERSPSFGGDGRGGGSSVAGLAGVTGGKAASRESRAGQDAVMIVSRHEAVWALNERSSVRGTQREKRPVCGMPFRFSAVWLSSMLCCVQL